MNLITLVMSCAPFVAPNTMMTIIEHESGNNPWAIGVNGSQKFNRPTNYSTAVSEAKRLVSIGANIDMGYTQINYKTMKMLGLTIEQVFDPCTNIYSGATVLTRNYINASKNIGNDQEALRAALSAYNTGNFRSGFKNGYVNKVVGLAIRKSQGEK